MTTTAVEAVGPMQKFRKVGGGSDLPATNHETVMLSGETPPSATSGMHKAVKRARSSPSRITKRHREDGPSPRLDNACTRLQFQPQSRGQDRFPELLGEATAASGDASMILEHSRNAGWNARISVSSPPSDTCEDGMPSPGIPIEGWTCVGPPGPSWRDFRHFRAQRAMLSGNTLGRGPAQLGLSAHEPVVMKALEPTESVPMGFLTCWKGVNASRGAASVPPHHSRRCLSHEATEEIDIESHALKERPRLEIEWDIREFDMEGHNCEEMVLGLHIGE
mmetsp:Transcript_7309/g.18270  ORF Transcript_7309/g.18270 Transcript_7309/m.18270 type:complete len:278 (-) Transcript_7309:158-991(-)